MEWNNGSIQINTRQTFLPLWNGQAPFHSGKRLAYSSGTGRRPMPPEMERPVECPLIWCTKINESILWLTWQASAMWISWSSIMTTCLWMLQNHWPVGFHVVRRESQWKDADSSGNSHSVVTVMHWSWGFCQSLAILPLLSPSGLHISVLNSFLPSNIPKC